MDRETIMRELLQVEEQILGHPGRTAQLRWIALQRIANIFGRNSDELRTELTRPMADQEFGLKIHEVDQRDGFRNLYVGEVFRLLHNYLAAIGTLIDHCRNLSREYSGRTFKKEFDRRVEAIAEVEVAKFFRDLRNYMLHHAQVPLLLGFGYTAGDPTMRFDVKLDSAVLLAEHRWTARARAYIERSEQIDLLVSIEEYQAAINDHYVWLFSQFRVLHGDEVDELRMLEERREVLLWLEEARST